MRLRESYINCPYSKDTDWTDWKEDECLIYVLSYSCLKS